MSRVGKNPVVFPDGVQVSANGRDITVKGSLGEMNWTVPHEVEFDLAEKEISFKTALNTTKAQALWGTSRALVANMVEGVSKGFERKLELRGVGYRSAMQGAKLNLVVGYSHPVNLDVPAGLKVAVEGNTNITVSGFDKQAVGEFSAQIRRVRPPEPYKGKGIRYLGEPILIKEGKKK